MSGHTGPGGTILHSTAHLVERLPNCSKPVLQLAYAHMCIYNIYAFSSCFQGIHLQPSQLCCSTHHTMLHLYPQLPTQPSLKQACRNKLWAQGMQTPRRGSTSADLNLAIPGRGSNSYNIIWK